MGRQCSLGKSAWRMRRDFYSQFDECFLNLGLPHEMGENGRCQIRRAEQNVVTYCRRDRRAELEPGSVQPRDTVGDKTPTLKWTPLDEEKVPLKQKGWVLPEAPAQSTGLGSMPSTKVLLLVQPLPVLQQQTFALTFLATEGCGLRSYRV